MEELPQEVLWRVGRMAGHKNAVNLGCCSRRLEAKVCNQEGFWAAFLIQDWGSKNYGYEYGGVPRNDWERDTRNDWRRAYLFFATQLPRTNNLFRFHAHDPRLRELYIVYCPAKHPYCPFDLVRNQGLDAVNFRLAQCRNLVTLRIRGTIDLADARALAAIVETNTTITTLDCKDCELNNQGMEVLAAAVSKNSTLRTVQVTSQYNEDIGYFYTPGPLAPWRAALARNTVLKRLFLGPKKVAGDCEAARALVQRLRNKGV